MCSVGDDFENEGDKNMPSLAKLNLSESKCNKCKDENPKVLLRGKDAYCNKCFLAGVTHKFKALLGKSRLIRPNDRVMVLYEVGHPSTALLHLLRTGLDLNTPKKLRFEPIVLFTEDQYHLTLDERYTLISKVLRDVELFEFQVHFVSFKNFVLNNDVVISDGNLIISDNDKDELNKIFPKGTSKTAKKEILGMYRRNMLVATAKKLNCKFVFTPDLSMSIASNLLTNIALGRGSQVPDDTGFCDDRDDHIKILKPLRLFDIKELCFYNILHNLEPISIRQPEVNTYSSIQDLMKKFVNDLQENYPATVTTIVKTGDKLALDKNKVIGNCKLCKGIILEGNEVLSSQEATNFSRLLSNELPDYRISRQERYNKIIEKFGDNTAQEHIEYCFSCSKLSNYLLDDT